VLLHYHRPSVWGCWQGAGLLGIGAGRDILWTDCEPCIGMHCWCDTLRSGLIFLAVGRVCECDVAEQGAVTEGEKIPCPVHQAIDGGCHMDGRNRGYVPAISVCALPEWT